MNARASGARRRRVLVTQIKVPGVGELLQFLLKFTVVPWFFTHP